MFEGDAWDGFFHAQHNGIDPGRSPEPPRLRPMASDSGLSDSQLENALQRVRSLADGRQECSNADDGWDLAEGSELALAAKRISPHQTSHLARSRILSAIDNLQALMLLTVEHRTLKAFAPATLARAVIVGALSLYDCHSGRPQEAWAAAKTERWRETRLGCRWS